MRSITITFTAVNLIMVAYGCATGWLSMAIPLLQSDATPLDTGKLSRTDLSWIASVLSLGALLGSAICGFVVTTFGTRNTIYAIGLPQLVSRLRWGRFYRPQPSVDSDFIFICCLLFCFTDQLAIYDIWHASISFGDLTFFKRFCGWRRTNVSIFICRRNRR